MMSEYILTQFCNSLMLSIDGSEENYLTFLGQDVLVFGNPSTSPRVDPFLRLQSLAPAANPSPAFHLGFLSPAFMSECLCWENPPSPTLLAEPALHIPSGFSALYMDHSPAASVGVLTGSNYLGVNSS